jgi:hypothetical protein
MKNSFNGIVVSLIIFLVSCKSKNYYINSSIQKDDSASVFYVDSAIVEKVNVYKKIEERVISADSILKLNSNIDEEVISDSIYNALKDFDENQVYEGVTLGFVRLEKNGDIFAISTDTTFLKFYILQNKKWQLINSFETDFVSYYSIVDLDNNGIKEIQAIGYPNMNGNHLNTFYSFSKTENKFIEGGSFFSGQFKFKPNDSRIEVNYEGSWYAPNILSIYYWKNNKLIPYKEVEVGLKIADMKHNAQYIKYSENLNLNKDSLQLIYKKTYRGRKLRNFFENFFEQ